MNVNTQFNDTKTAFSYKDNKELRRAYLIFSILNRPVISKLLIKAGKLALLLRLPITQVFKKTFFAHFCGGETLKQCQGVIKKLAKHNVKTVLDYSVEGEKTEEGFEETTAEIIRALALSQKDDRLPFCVFKITGVSDSALLEKIQSGAALTDGERASFEQAKKRVDAICAKAHEYQVPILIDAESSWFQNPVNTIAYAMMQKYNTNKAIVFNTFQMYKMDTLAQLQQAHQKAISHGYVLGVKIVRGAYMEEEQKRALSMNYPNPIFTNKKDTDTAFNTGLAFCVQCISRIALLCGSHNEYSNRYLTLLVKQHQLQNNDSRIWFIQLYGMNDNASFDLASNGYNVAKYMPYGPIKSVIPYLMRRAEENTSVAGQSSRELALIRQEIQRRK